MRTKVTSKKMIKKNGGRSPDLADALSHTFGGVSDRIPEKEVLKKKDAWYMGEDDQKEVDWKAV